MEKPKVYVNCCTYNQVNYIRDALEGFVMQKTNFPFEVHVNDDASTDGTQEIIKEYAEKYPHIIKPLLRTVNTNAQENYSDSWKAVNCEYFANCEGDDYWTDPNKLQIQVDFLDAHPDFSGCFHRHKTIFADGSHEDIRNCPEIPGDPDVITLNDLMGQENFISNASIMYRWRFNRTTDKIEDWWPKRNIDPGDWFLHLSHLQKGNFAFIKREMSAWRVQKDGIWYGRFFASPFMANRFWQRRGETYLAFLDECHERFGMEIEDKRKEIFRNIILSSIYFKDFSIVERLLMNRGTSYTCSKRPYEDKSSFEENNSLGAVFDIINNKKTIKKAFVYWYKLYKVLSFLSFSEKKRKKKREKYILFKNLSKNILDIEWKL